MKSTWGRRRNMRIIIDVSGKTWPVNALEQCGPALSPSEKRYLQGCSLSDLVSLEILHGIFTSAIVEFVRFAQGYV